MLELLRRQSLLIYAIFGAIITIFAINFGPGSGGCTAKIQPKQWVARVDGATVGPELFGLYLQQQYESMRRRADAAHVKLDRQLAERLGIRRQVVDMLVERRLIVAESEARGIEVSDARLQEALREQYRLKEPNYAAYAYFVARNYNMSVEQFETFVREELASRYLMRTLREAVDVSEDELFSNYAREHERLKINYAKFPIAWQDVPVPGEAAIAALLEHEPGALQAVYDRDIAEFATPAMARAAHIIRRVDSNASAEELAEATREMASIQQQLAQGADFMALVQKYAGAEHFASHNGEGAWHTEKDFPPHVAAALFGLPVDQVSPEPVRSQTGLYLFKKLEERAPGRKQLDEIRPELASRVLRGRVAVARAQKSAERFLAELRRGKRPFAELTRMAGEESLRLGTAPRAGDERPEGRESGWLRRADVTLGALGEAPQIVEAAFGTDGKGLERPGDVLPEPMLVEDGVVAVQLKVREHTDQEAFAKERDELYESLRAHKQQRIVMAWLGQLRSQAKVTLNPAYLAPAATTDAGEEPTPDPAEDEG